MPATVAQLVTIRSELADSLLGYYDTVIREVGDTPWHRPVTGQPHETEVIQVSRVAIPVRVLKKVIKPRLEHSPDSAGDRDDGGRRGRPGGEYIDPRTAQFYEEAPGNEETEEVPWSRERKRSEIKRVIVLGGPGGGKTFLTRLTAVEIAEEGRVKLLERRVPLDELPIPVWLDLESLASAAAVDDPAFNSEANVSGSPTERMRWPTNCFLAVLRRKYEIADCLADWIAHPVSRNQVLAQEPTRTSELPRLAATRCWLILDALDQVPEPKHLWPLLEAIEAQRWECKVVLTCRTADYAKPPWKKITEYSLAPFGYSDIRKLITKWFGTENPRGQALLSAIKLNYSLRHACRSPLLVTLACMVGESPSSRRGLYGLALDDLLRMRWHRPEERRTEESVDYLGAVLRPAAWQLFSSAPESNRFPYGAMIDAITAADPSAHMSLKEAAEIKEELNRRGLIFASGREDGETQYSFIHKTFLEYLAAEHLCRILRKDGWDKAIVSWKGQCRVRVDLLVKKMTWLPSWQETLVMLTAALGEDKDPEKAAQMVGRMMELMVDGR